MFKVVSGAAAAIILCLATSPSHARDNAKTLKDLAISQCPNLFGMAASIAEAALASRRIKIGLTEDEVQILAIGVCGVIAYYHNKENTESGSITKPGAVIKPEALCPHATDLETLAWCRSQMPPARSPFGPGPSSRQLIEETDQAKTIKTPKRWIGECDESALDLQACLDRGLPR